jgi:hypothetical protein
VGFYSKLHPGIYLSFSDFIKHALEVLTVEEMKLLVVILWENWKERCAIFHGEQPKSRYVFNANSLSIWQGMLEVEKMVQGTSRSLGRLPRGEIDGGLPLLLVHLR